MAELSTLARPYAKAAFDYAKEQNAINDWESFLSNASKIVENEDFFALLNNPAVSADNKVKVMMDVLAEQEKASHNPIAQSLQTAASHGVDVSSVAEVLGNTGLVSSSDASHANFAKQLAENDRLALLPEILIQYSKLKSQELKQVDAYVTSAYPLTETQRKSLQESLAVSTGAIVILHEKVDASLLGGATIKVGDKFTDGSVRGKLNQLKTQLIA